MLIPSVFLPKNREKILHNLYARNDLESIKNRVDYYCQLSQKVHLDSNAWRLKDLRWTHKKTVYFFDSYEYAMYFPQDFRANFEFGDVNYICKKPSITKSRPICKANLACGDFLDNALASSSQRNTKSSQRNTNSIYNAPPSSKIPHLA